MRDQGGFSLVELLVVLALIGILANVLVPVLWDSIERTTATRILTDVDLIGDAARRYRVDVGRYPDSGAWGQAPAGLEPYLPDDYPFRYGEILYVWWRFGSRLTVWAWAPDEQNALRRAVDTYGGEAHWLGNWGYFVIQLDE